MSSYVEPMIPSKVYMVYFSRWWGEPIHALGVFDSVEGAEAHICKAADNYRDLELKNSKYDGVDLTITDFCRDESKVYPDILDWTEVYRFVSHKELGVGNPTDVQWDETIIGIWEVYEYEINDGECVL